MTKVWGGFILAAAVAAALAIGSAAAQTTPAEPFQPGAAAADAPPPEAAKSAQKVADKVTARARAKPKRQKPEPGGMISVVVDNKRSVGLESLTIAPAGGEAKKVAGPLAFGRKTTIRIKRAKDCRYDIHGHFADDADTDQVGVDLCKDKVINLTDE